MLRSDGINQLIQDVFSLSTAIILGHSMSTLDGVSSQGKYYNSLVAIDYNNIAEIQQNLTRCY